MRGAFGLFACATLLAAPSWACVANPSSSTAYPSSVVLDGDAEGGITEAWYDDPTTRYPHFVLGRQDEPATLRVNGPEISPQCGLTYELDASHVFEDTAPRLFDLDGDGQNEVITVRSNVGAGAQIAVFGLRNGGLQLLVTNPPIGTPFRWLAPVGIGDLDGDGAIEIAYIDRPHLARTLRVWRWENDGLTEVAAGGGVTNHRIGEETIAGGLRDCGDGPEMIMATADWSSILAVTFSDGELDGREIASGTSPSAFAAALKCAQQS
jgi:hypothetical protein